MDILRPGSDGRYRCINNPGNKRSYVLVEREGCFPTLIPQDKFHSSQAEPVHPPSHAVEEKDVQEDN